MSDHYGEKQAGQPARVRKSAFFIALLLAFALFNLTACGKRPGFVDPPPEVENDHFPLVYPDPSTDPKP